MVLFRCDGNRECVGWGVIASVIIGVILLVFVNKKSHVHPYILVLECDSQESENKAKEFIQPHVARSVVRS